MAHQFELAISISEFIENLGNETSALALALKRLLGKSQEKSSLYAYTTVSTPTGKSFYIVRK